MRLSRLWQSQGKREEARKALEEVHSWFTEGFTTPDLIEAKALLDPLDVVIELNHLSVAAKRKGTWAVQNVAVANLQRFAQSFSACVPENVQVVVITMWHG